MTIISLFQTNMIVKDNSAYDKGIADFFGDAALAEQFSKLVKVSNWNSQHMWIYFICVYQHLYMFF